VEFEKLDSPQSNRIQILLSKSRRIVVEGDVDVSALVRLISAIERC
jgi:hypothetical protein